jgi:hypothetical protein
VGLDLFVTPAGVCCQPWRRCRPTGILCASGWVLVANDPIERADIIVVSRAMLVALGRSKQPTSFTAVWPQGLQFSQALQIL